MTKGGVAHFGLHIALPLPAGCVALWFNFQNLGSKFLPLALFLNQIHEFLYVREEGLNLAPALTQPNKKYV